MLSSFWPVSLKTLHVELGGSFDEGRDLLSRLGAIDERTDEKEGHTIRVDLPTYSIAIYESQGRIRSVWYDDPSGRRLEVGKKRKLHLYLRRYARSGTWVEKMNNGWMTYWFNEEDKRMLVYGLHKDVIRLNDQTL